VELSAWETDNEAFDKLGVNRGMEGMGWGRWVGRGGHGWQRQRDRCLEQVHSVVLPTIWTQIIGWTPSTEAEWEEEERFTSEKLLLWQGPI